MEMPGLQFAGEKSVAGRYRRTITAEAVVHAHGDHVHVLVDATVSASSKGGYDERIVGVAHEQVVVFDAGRPVRSEAILESDPTVAPQRVELAEASSTSPSVVRMLKLLLVTAAPPFT